MNSTKRELARDLAWAHGYIAVLSLLLALSRAAEDNWFWAALWLLGALIWGGLSVVEYRDCRRAE